jgi:hypothetical protein
MTTFELKKKLEEICEATDKTLMGDSLSRAIFFRKSVEFAVETAHLLIYHRDGSEQPEPERKEP